jgi:kumamolisin
MGRFRPYKSIIILALLAAGCHSNDRLLDLSGEEQPDAGVIPQPEVPVAEPAPVAPTPAPTLAEPTRPPVPLDFTPTPAVHGIPKPLENVYRDLGVADPDDTLRGLLALPIRELDTLEQSVRNMYDPAHPEFRKYLNPVEWNRRHAPHEDDVKIVTDWLESQGFQVLGVASNRLLIYFKGKVAQFSKAFGVPVHYLERKSPQIGNPPHRVYGLMEEIIVPKFVEERIYALVGLDLDDFEGRTPPVDATPTVGGPEELKKGYTPAQIARAYGVDKLYAQGFRGRKSKVGIVVGGGIRMKEMRHFWQTWGIQRSDPFLVATIEQPKLNIREAALDVEWAGAMAPESDIVVYMGPDARNTSMIYTYNEAIARAEVDVITNSFAHREDSEPRAVRWQYHYSSLAGASLGITLAAASGDSAGVDTPSNSSYVTAVGGTLLGMIDMDFRWEVAWEYSGSGISLTIPAPWWQAGLPGVDRKRAVVDVALNSGMGYWYLWLNRWWPNIGTSFASPVFAGLISVVNDARAAEGKPPLGWINSHLYTMPEVQKSFRDITQGHTTFENGTTKYRSGPGWDIPTGWGAPDAEGLLRTMP